MQIVEEVDENNKVPLVFYRISMLISDTSGERLIEFSINKDISTEGIKQAFEHFARRVVNPSAR